MPPTQYSAARTCSPCSSKIMSPLPVSRRLMRRSTEYSPKARPDASAIQGNGTCSADETRSPMMDLWSGPMTGQTVAFLLAELAVILGLIGLELRRHTRTESVGPRRAQGLVRDAVIRTVALLGLMAVVFTVIGSLFGAGGAAVALAMAAATALRSFWQTGPAILARCGARSVTDPSLIEAVQELAAKAGIPAPRILEIQEPHPNAFALGSDPAHASIILTVGLRRRLTHEELRAVMGHEISHITNRDTLSATLGVTLLSAIGRLALLLGLVGLAARRQ